MPVKHERYHYKHMLPRDTELWNHFLEQHGGYFDRFIYDEHVGEGVGDIYGYEPWVAQLAKSLTQKRIDAVGYRGGEVWLFEIKPKAGLAALGQIIAYEALWETGGRLPHVYRKAIVTDRTDGDIKTVADLYGVKVYEVG